MLGHKFWIRYIGPRSHIVHLQIPFSLDTMTAYQLQEKLENLIQRGDYSYIIDFYEVTYISSAGIEALSRIQQELQCRGGRVILINVSEKISSLLAKVGVFSRFHIMTSVKQALQEFERDEQ